MADDRRMCPHCRAFINAKDRVCPYCNEAVGPRRRSLEFDSGSGGGGFIGGFIPQANFVTVLILLINFGLYAAMTLHSMQSGNEAAFLNLDDRTLDRFGGTHPLRTFLQGQYWRLVVAGFLHAGILHILMNSWALFDLSAQVESVYGPSRLAVFYFAATVGGFFLSSVTTGAPSVGASAGIFGLIGAMIALGVGRRAVVGPELRGLYIRWAVYGLLLGFLFPAVDMAAHIGGLACGFGAAWLSLQTIRLETAWKAAAWVCVGLTVLSFANMFMWFRFAASR